MSDNPVFEYRISFLKQGKRYRLISYNSPYKSSEQELEDISLMLDGVDLNGTAMKRYKVIAWEDLDDGKYMATVSSFYTPNPEGDGSFDQTFKLKEVKLI